MLGLPMRESDAAKFFLILRNPIFYFNRGLRKLDHKLTVRLLGKIRRGYLERTCEASGVRVVFILENIGDTIRAVPVLGRLDENDWVVCTKYNRSIIEMLGMKNTITLNRDPGLVDFLKLLLKLKPVSFSASIVLDCSKSGSFGIVSSRFLKTGKIYSGFETGVEGDMHIAEILIDDKNTDILSLAKASIAQEIFFTGGERPRKEINIQCHDAFKNYEDFIGIHIGGIGSVDYAVSRQYPDERILEITMTLLNKGYKVLFTGDVADRERFAKYAKMLRSEKGFADLSGKLDIKQLACLLKSLKCYITPDNGTLHLAQAVGCRKVLAIIGPTSPALVRGRNTEILRLDLACSPCIQFIKFPARCVNHENNACLNKMEPEIILDRLIPYLDEIGQR
jgi:Glycosyltransferase family 9 (heptosyltransferase)